MPHISVLSKEVAEKIAAGEVVERPASVVKELVENAIDAGAKSITIEFKNGGISFLRITDDGSGIAYEDVPTAFLRHATSKISSENDLEQIRTMGFRGEALASIAAVCKVELLTKTAEETSGTHYVIEGLEEKSYEPVGCPVGTTIVVRDIFFNTPARMKFLRKDVAEGNAVSSIVDKLALANPEISFSLIRDGREVLFTPGDGKVISAVNAVLGRQFASGLIPVSYEHNGVKIEGYVSRPEATRATRTMQHFFVNGRYVKYAAPFVAVTDAYKHRIMTGKFPACVLFLSLNPVLLDVNVHPTKTEVKFASDKTVYDALFFSVRSSLDQFFKPKPVELSSAPKPSAQPVVSEVPQQQVLSSPVLRSHSLSNLKNDEEEKKNPHTVQDSTLSKENIDVGDTANRTDVRFSTRPSFSKGNFRLNQSVPVLQKGMPRDTSIAAKSEPSCFEPITQSFTSADKIEEDNVPNNEFTKEVCEQNSDTVLRNLNEKTEKAIENPSEYKILGEAFSTYLIVQNGEELLLIDKHAAHERYLFNQLKTRAASDDRQILLSPVQIRLSKELYTALIEHREDLLKLGFLADDFGDGFVIIREIPMYLPESQTLITVEEIAANFAQNKSSVTPSLLDDLLHNMACRAAVKAGDENRFPELSEIVEIVLKDRNVRYCPHGRPVAIVLTKKQLEKQFGRSV